MLITLHRSGPRVLFVHAHTPLTGIPREALNWIGQIETSVDSELDVRTAILGLSAPAILYDVTVHGYCAFEVPESDTPAACAD